MRQDRPIDPVRDRKRFQAFAGLKRRERKWWNDRNVSAALKRRENGTLWHLRPESQEEIGDGLALSKARNFDGAAGQPADPVKDRKSAVWNVDDPGVNTRGTADVQPAGGFGRPARAVKRERSTELPNEPPTG